MDVGRDVGLDVLGVGVSVGDRVVGLGVGIDDGIRVGTDVLGGGD